MEDKLPEDVQSAIDNGVVAPEEVANAPIVDETANTETTADEATTSTEQVAEAPSEEVPAEPDESA